MNILRRIRYWLHHRQSERDLAEEIEFHRSLADNPSEMGNITRSREDARAVWIWPWLQSVWQDVSYAVRSLRRQPGFTAVALLALGIAIGMNTSLFSAFNAVALRPWPVKDPGRMVKVFSVSPRPINGTFGRSGLRVVEFRYLAEHTTTFTGLIIMAVDHIHFGFEPFGKPSGALFVAGDHFRVLDVDMQVGRGFLPEEDRLQAPEAVMVLSYALWRDHFGSDPAIVGTQVRVDEIPFTVVGVASRNFLGTSGEQEDAWFPLPAFLLLHPNDPEMRKLLTQSDSCCIPAGGRLKPGVTRQQAEAELEVLSRQFRTAGNSKSKVPPTKFSLAPPTLLAGDGDGEEIMQGFAVVFVGVMLVVLLACANVGNLLIARASARQREIEVRRSVGAGRARIVRQLLTESLVLALGASALGIALTYWLPALVLARIGAPPFELKPDWRVLSYALGLAVFACLCFGLAPAIHGTRPRPNRSRLPLRSFLLAVQVALSVVLLISAGLLFEGIRRAQGQDPRFAIQDVAVVSFEMPASAYNQDNTRAFSSRLFSDLQSAVGAESFALTRDEPLSRSNWNTVFRLPEESEDQRKGVRYQEVSPGYFGILRIPIVAGRDFEPADSGRRVILVNETMARRYWQGLPLGKSVFAGGTSREIIGVVQDSYSAGLNQIEPMFYQPFTGAMLPKVLVRSTPGTADTATAVAARIDSRARTQVKPLSESLDRWLIPSRAGAQIAALLGGFALALAAVGMFGVFAYAVQQRTKEIGLRMALGAHPMQVIRLVLGGNSRAVCIGMAVGMIGAAAGARLLQGLLYGVSPLDPRTYAEVALVLGLTALAASFLPARRAARIDPMTALRHE